jgi:hypothetical protein
MFDDSVVQSPYRKGRKERKEKPILLFALRTRGMSLTFHELVKR